MTTTGRVVTEIRNHGERSDIPKWRSQKRISDWVGGIVNCVMGDKTKEGQKNICLIERWYKISSEGWYTVVRSVAAWLGQDKQASPRVGKYLAMWQVLRKVQPGDILTWKTCGNLRENSVRMRFKVNMWWDSSEIVTHGLNIKHQIWSGKWRQTTLVGCKEIWEDVKSFVGRGESRKTL